MRLILLVCTMFAALQAQACECVEPMTSETARAARHVFIFRVLSTQVGEVDGGRMLSARSR
jgi:hypothetical protein